MPFNQQGMMQPGPMSQFPQQLLQPKQQQQQGGGMNLGAMLPLIMQMMGSGGGQASPQAQGMMGSQMPGANVSPLSLGNPMGQGGASGPNPAIAQFLQQMRMGG